MARSGFIALLVVVPTLIVASLICVQFVRKSKQEKRRQWFISAAKKVSKDTPSGMEQHYLHPVKKPSIGVNGNHAPSDITEG